MASIPSGELYDGPDATSKAKPAPVWKPGSSASMFSLGFVGRKIELDQLALKAPCLDRAINNSNSHPDAAGDFGGPAKMEPDKQADEKSEKRRKEVCEALFFLAQVIADECRGVDSHERDQCAEVEHFRAEVVAHQERPGQRDGADEENVVARNTILRLDRAKEFSGQRVAAAHAEEKPGGAQMRAHARADVGDQEGQVHEAEQKHTSNPS